MQTQTEDPYYLKLRGEKQKALDLALCQMVEDTVSACADRDDDLRKLRDQLEGYSQPSTNLPWPDACEIEDTLCRELHTTLTAAIFSAAKQTPYVCLESINRNDIDTASDVESWMNIKAQQYGYEDALYDAIYLALEGRYAPMYVGYRQEIVKSFELKKGEPTIEGEEPDDESIVLSEKPGSEGIEFRSPNPWDVYFYPVTARGVQVNDGCIAVMERMYLTREDLMLGVLREGYDEDAVGEMLRRGPASLSDMLDDELQRDGLNQESDAGKDPSMPWECFQVIGRAPLLPNDEMEPTIPEALQHTDCMWMCCPALKIVFKQSYSPFPSSLRPYALYHAIKKPGLILGEGLVSLLGSIQDEMTAITRFGINNMNLEASPVMVVTESWLSRYSKWTIAPGRTLPRAASDPIGPKPLTWDVRSQTLIMPWLQLLDSRGHRVAASESVNSALAGRVRKAAEVHFAEEMQQTKFDLFLSNIQKGVKETFRLMMAILMQHLPAQGEAANTGTAEVKVTPDDLKREFRFLPQASSDAVSPATRLNRQQAITQIVLQYWQIVPQAMQMGNLQYMYALHHRLLILAGERSPERYIGPDPSSQQQPQGMVMPMIPPQGMAMLQGMMGQPQDNGAGLLQSSPFTPRGNGTGG